MGPGTEREPAALRAISRDTGRSPKQVRRLFARRWRGSFLVQCACDAVVRVLAELDADELAGPFGV
jgi:hypothetical protein